MLRTIGLRVSLALGLLSAGMTAPAVAAPPTVVVSLASIEDLLDDADFLGESVGVPGVKQIAESNLDAFTGGAGLAGVDREKPLGLYWNIESGAPNDMGAPVVFLPISDAAAFKKLVGSLVPDLKDQDGQWTMSVAGQELFATISEDYCFISTAAKGLGNLSDPEKLVNADYDIAIDVNLASIPKQLKASFLEITEREGRKSLENGPAPKSDAEAAGQKLGFEWTLAALKTLTNDGERLTLGLSVDDESRLTSIDLGLTGKSNSTLAKSLAVFGKTTPAFAAVASESAALTLMLSHPTTGLIDQLDDLFTAMRKSTDAEIEKDPKLKDDADKKAAKDVAKRLLNIAQATVKSGSLHSIVVLEEGDDDTVRIIGGTKVAKGDDAAKLLDDIVKLSKESPEFAKVKIDVAKHAGARIHSIEGDFDDKHAALFGENPTHLAIRPDSLWISLGGGNLEALKTALELSGKKPSGREAPISLRVKPATLVTLMEQNDEGLVKRAEALAGEPGDVFNIEIAPGDKGGIKLHIEFGVDLVKLGMNQ